MGTTIAQDGTIELDLTVMDEAGLAETGMTPALKSGSRLIFGQDIRDAIYLIPIDQWARERMHAAYWLMTHIFHRPPIITLPLGYPDPEDEFFGYARRMLAMKDGRKVPCTRDLIRVTGWAATALLAYQAKQFVSTKKDCASLYHTYMHDGWASFHEVIYNRCRLQWNYLIPENESDRAELRNLCRLSLEFENHFLMVYKKFVLLELRSGDFENIGRVLWVLDRIPFQDAEILETLANISESTARIHP